MGKMVEIKNLKKQYDDKFKLGEISLNIPSGVIVGLNMFFPELLNAKDINDSMKNIYKNWDSQLYFSYLKGFHLEEKM